MTPEQAAEHILKAAGSSLRHYTPQSREAIVKAADDVRRVCVEAAWTTAVERRDLDGSTGEGYDQGYMDAVDHLSFGIEAYLRARS